MGHLTDIQLLRAHFLAHWNGKDENGKAVAVVQENDIAHTPKGAPYVRFSVDPASSTRKSVVNNLTERNGRIWMQVCVPATTGNVLAWSLADAAKSIFEFQTIKSGNHRVLCRSSSSTTVEDDDWFIVSTSVAYTSHS